MMENAIEKRDWNAPVASPKNMQGMLEMMRSQIAMALPRHITPERMIRVALTALSRSPKLLECTATSVIGCVIESSQLGLELNGPLQQAYAVPYWNGKTKRMEAQFIPGYRGLVQLARQSGDISNVQAACVYERDKYTFRRGLNPVLEHEEYPGADHGELIAAYAIATLKDGSQQYEWMWRHELEKVRNASKSRNKAGELVGPWVDWTEEMYKKTAIKRLCKLLPMSTERENHFARAVAMDTTAESGERQIFDLQPIGISEEDQDPIHDQREALRADMPVNINWLKSKLDADGYTYAEARALAGERWGHARLENLTDAQAQELLEALEARKAEALKGDAQ